MKKFYKQHTRLVDYFIWLIWAVGLGLCFPTYNQPYLLWFIFVPVIVFAYTKPINKTVLYAFLASLILWWMTTYWLVAFHEAALPFVSPSYALFNGIYFFAIAYFGKKVKKARWLITPTFWVMNEFIRSSGYVGFKWNLLGDALFKNPVLIQSVDIWGVWGLSFLIILCNAVLAEFVIIWIESGSFFEAFKKNSIKVCVASGLLVFNLVYGVITYNYYQNMSESAPKEKLALLQPNIGSFEPWWENIWTHYGMLWKMHAEVALEQPDLIVWSETIVRNYVWYYWRLYPQSTEINQFDYRVFNLPFEVGIPTLITHPDKDLDGKSYNTAEFLNPFEHENLEGFSKVATNYSYAKIHLVPFGEWMPYYEKIPVVRDILDQAGAAAYSGGSEFKIFESLHARFGVLICFEDIFSIMARKFVKGGVNYFLNTTNDGWAYRWEVGTDLPLWQHTAAATLVAVSVRRPIARAVNTGVTCVIDVTGDIFVSDIGLYERGYYIHDISIIDENLETIYVKAGFLFPYLTVLAGFLAFIYAIFFIKSPLPAEIEK